MYPRPSFRQQKGAGLPIALFIITVLALLVVGMAQLQESSGQAISLQIQSQRAFFAAESGAQVGVRDVLESDSCGAISTPVNFSQGGLSDCTAALECESLSTGLGGPGGNVVFTITSTGQCGVGGEDESKRVVEVRIR
jgi:MSHA biogenesis protein MshP